MTYLSTSFIIFNQQNKISSIKTQYLLTIPLKINKRMFEHRVVCKHTKVHLAKQYHKILYLHPALNDTFVFLGTKDPRKNCVVHVNKNGHILFEHVFPIPLDTFGMLDQKSCIMLRTQNKWYLSPIPAQQQPTSIMVLDLQTHKFTKTPFYFLNQETDQSFIETFSRTKYLCIRQNGRYNDNRFKLSYFNFPLTQNSVPFNTYQSKQDQWTYEYMTKQANHHSMICWFKPRQDKQWDFRTYDIRDNPQGKLSIYKIKQQVGIPYGIKDLQIATNTMWQVKKNEFMMVCISNRNQSHKNKQLDVIQNNYILNVQTKKVREAKFSFKQYQDREYSMFRTFDFKDSKPLRTPIFFIHNESETIIAQTSWKCSYLHKDEQTGVSNNTIIHNQYENGDCKWFECQKISIEWKLPEMIKEVTLNFIQNLYENFDQDFIQEVMEMIKYQ